MTIALWIKLAELIATIVGAIVGCVSDYSGRQRSTEVILWCAVTVFLWLHLLFKERGERWARNSWCQ